MSMLLTFVGQPDSSGGGGGAGCACDLLLAGGGDLLLVSTALSDLCLVQCTDCLLMLSKSPGYLQTDTGGFVQTMLCGLSCTILLATSTGSLVQASGGYVLLDNC
jgi:hypothetical protein